MRTSLMSVDLEETDELSTLQASLEGEIFDTSLQVKKLLLMLSHKSGSPTSSSDRKGVKLPKLYVPTFDGNILHWRSFWEQFCASVYTIVLASLILKNSFTCNNRSRMGPPRAPLKVFHGLGNTTLKLLSAWSLAMTVLT